MKKLLMYFAVVLTAVAVQAQISNKMIGAKVATTNLDEPCKAAGSVNGSNEFAPLLINGFVSLDNIGTMYNGSEARLQFQTSQWQLAYTDMNLHGFANFATGASSVSAAPAPQAQGRICSCTSHAHRPARFPLCTKRCP